MIARPTRLTPPDKNRRYPSLTVEGMIGTLVLRMPIYSVCSEVIEMYRLDVPAGIYAAGYAADVAYGKALHEAEENYAAACAAASAAGADVPERPADPVKPEDGHPREPRAETMARTERLSGAVVGLCWYHTAFALETTRLDGEGLPAYGLRVCEELYDAGLSFLEVQTLGSQILSLIATHLSDGMTVKAEGLGVGKP